MSKTLKYTTGEVAQRNGHVPYREGNISHMQCTLDRLQASIAAQQRHAVCAMSAVFLSSSM